MASRIIPLRKIPIHPVVFFYHSDNDPMPIVQVMTLQHDKAKPGFLGVNLNYIDPKDKELVVNYYRNVMALAGDTDNLDQFRNLEIERMTNCSLRSYNYCKIKEFIYRGAKQDHNRV